MPNINDYIKWRGDLELNVSEFNEIDSLILARFSYLPFESLMKKEEELTIEELSKRFEKADKGVASLTIFPWSLYIGECVDL